jgi:hypothetical protein
LNQNVEHDPMLIDSAPEPMLLTGLLITTSSSWHLSPDAGRRRQICLAKFWPNFGVYSRTVS